ncbi:1-acyl-sn-glycerol-3-phosphate acyltransferase [Nocardioides sp.]|uniref:lysophospholipid acyltransferase family protein n=1 Tax=Nocardioides sp. TaxID=35761 RepID=UPI002721A774|nr:lysophospholipid acyltransferase family protein [Nocardioides sp.]MDO9456318.1 lysophospholipid acyltransferase family protein [Nocardioides sp.]
MTDRTYRAVIAAGKVALRGLDLRVRSQGAEHLPADGPVVLACNHVSFPDFLYVGQALLGTGRLVRFLCRADIWDSPAGRLMETMRHVPVDREAPAAAYLRARSLLREGEVVCVFPEAGISAAYAVRAMMPGAVALARETGAPLVPVTVWGGQRLWGQKRSLDAPFPRPEVARGRTVDVVVGAPWRVPPDADLVGTTRRLGTTLQATLDGLQRLPEHRPRPGEWAPWHPAHLGGDALDRQTSYALDGMPRSAVTPTWSPAVE